MSALEGRTEMPRNQGHFRFDPFRKSRRERLARAFRDFRLRAAIVTSNAPDESALMNTLAGLDPATGTAVSFRAGNRDMIVLTRHMTNRLRHLVIPAVSTPIIII